MERVTFLVDGTGERISCLLNPSSLVVRRSAAIRRVSSTAGTVTGTSLSDDPLIATGGGRTELQVDLLFDTSLLDTSVIDTSSIGTLRGDGSSVDPSLGDGRPSPATDVRDMTRPLWRLSENQSDDGVFGGPEPVRFVWGKAWNVRCVVAAIAERVEQFSSDGSPQRSWIRMRLLRVADAPATVDRRPASPLAIADAAAQTQTNTDAGVSGEPPTTAFEVIGGERVDSIASQLYGQPWLWRFVAATNDLDDVPFVRSGTVLGRAALPALPEPLVGSVR
jgi:hypothetical protein